MLRSPPFPCGAVSSTTRGAPGAAAVAAALADTGASGRVLDSVADVDPVVADRPAAAAVGAGVKRVGAVLAPTPGVAIAAPADFSGASTVGAGAGAGAGRGDRDSGEGSGVAATSTSRSRPLRSATARASNAAPRTTSNTKLTTMVRRERPPSRSAGRVPTTGAAGVGMLSRSV